MLPKLAAFRFHIQPPKNNWPFRSREP